MASLIELAEAGLLTFTWRAVGDKNMCPDCAERHGDGGWTLAEWQSRGLPGTGTTICWGACRCVLLPDDLVEVETEILEPFEIGPVLAGIVAETPLEAARLAVNTRLIDDYPVGSVVEYQGVRGTIIEVSIDRMRISLDAGAGVIDVYDFTEVSLGG